MPQPALPEVPGSAAQALARGAAGRSAAGRVLPRGLHAAGAHCRHRLPEQGRVYGLLFDVAAETLLTIAADPKHLGARIGATLVLHTWGSALTHHPHVHGIVPGGGLAPGRQALGRLPAGVLPAGARALAPVPAALPRRAAASCIGRASCSSSASTRRWPTPAFAQWLAPLRQCEWVVYAKRPFAGPQAVLAYLSRYTHRVAISNSRLSRMDERGVTLPLEGLPRQGPHAHKTMTLDAEEFMRRFLLHVLPGGFHRIRHYGLLANGSRKANLALRASCWVGLTLRRETTSTTHDRAADLRVPALRPPMIVLQTFTRGQSFARRLCRPTAMKAIASDTATARRPSVQQASAARPRVAARAKPPTARRTSIQRRAPSARRSNLRCRGPLVCAAHRVAQRRRRSNRHSTQLLRPAAAWAAVSSPRLVQHLPSDPVLRAHRFVRGQVSDNPKQERPVAR